MDLFKTILDKRAGLFLSLNSPLGGISTGAGFQRDKEMNAAGDAASVFDADPVSSISPTSSNAFQSPYSSGLPSFETDEDTLLGAAANNFALCALHLRKLPLAISTLERLIATDPVAHMLDPIVFNLCTMYDLSHAPEQSATKKKVLQRVASIYRIEDLHWRSFRLS